jgi:23S rRNA pseudouridine2604 synthase
MRVDKYISTCTEYSLRNALELIAQKRVKLNGRIVQSNPLVKKKDVISIDDKVVVFNAPQAIYLAYNKPRGIECTADRNNKDNLIDAVNYPNAKIINIGRLDKDSEGLLLLTNDGDIVNKIIHSDFKHEKEYLVRVNESVSNPFIIEQMEGGLDLWDYVTQPCKIEVLDETDQYFKIILQEGKNRQIRRMFEKFGYEVIELKRVRVLNVELEKLAIGAYRDLTRKELSVLSIMIGYSIPERLEIKY